MRIKGDYEALVRGRAGGIDYTAEISSGKGERVRFFEAARDGVPVCRYDPHLYGDAFIAPEGRPLPEPVRKVLAGLGDGEVAPGSSVKASGRAFGAAYRIDMEPEPLPDGFPSGTGRIRRLAVLKGARGICLFDRGFGTLPLEDRDIGAVSEIAAMWDPGKENGE